MQKVYIFRSINLISFFLFLSLSHFIKSIPRLKKTDKTRLNTIAKYKIYHFLLRYLQRFLWIGTEINSKTYAVSMSRSTTISG